jgi:Flp pilus assembly protein TadD
MKRWVLVLILGVGLLLGSWAPRLAAADKVKEAMEKAYQDYIKYGLILAAEGSDEKAAQAFRQAIKVQPQAAEAHSLLGSSLARLGRYRQAEEELRQAVTLKPDYAEGYYYLGLFLKEMGKEQEAQEAFAKAKQYQR